MSDVTISVRGLSKSYLVGHKLQRIATDRMLRDAVMRSARGLLRSASDVLHGRPIVSGDEIEEFWALRDVTFDIRRGERVGIIGRNGAGKSTLLKILSRITEPTNGRARIRGRIASLLEVGTGFHPELTGRENIYLNGAVLGMKRVEIRKKFDEIVAFAESEVEKFLDTPVKRYSSGMYLRLAFAVAAHLDAENMIVDEVLAVGDIEFQRKCLRKMDEISTAGRTVLFVTHSVEFLRRLCTTGMLLHDGHLEFFGDVPNCVKQYFGAGVGPGSEAQYQRSASRAVNSDCYILAAWLEQGGTAVGVVDPTVPLDVYVRVEIERNCRLSLELLVRDYDFQPIIFVPMGLGYGIEHSLSIGTYLLRARLRLPTLAVGIYAMDTMLAEAGKRFYDVVDSALKFNVSESLSAQTGWVFRQERGQGCILLNDVACSVVDAA